MFSGVGVGGGAFWFLSSLMTSVVAERIVVVSSVTFWICCYCVYMKCHLTPVMS